MSGFRMIQVRKNDVESLMKQLEGLTGDEYDLKATALLHERARDGCLFPEDSIGSKRLTVKEMVTILYHPHLVSPIVNDYVERLRKLKPADEYLWDANLVYFRHQPASYTVFAKSTRFILIGNHRKQGTDYIILDLTDETAKRIDYDSNEKPTLDGYRRIIDGLESGAILFKERAPRLTDVIDIHETLAGAEKSENWGKNTNGTED